MNKLLNEGRRLAELAKENPHSVGESYTAGGWTNLGKHKEYHDPETMLKIYSLIDEMREALEFYADSKSYWMRHDSEDGFVNKTDLDFDLGKKARAVLQKFEGEKMNQQKTATELEHILKLEEKYKQDCKDAGCLGCPDCKGIYF